MALDKVSPACCPLPFFGPQKSHKSININKHGSVNLFTLQWLPESEGVPPTFFSDFLFLLFLAVKVKASLLLTQARAAATLLSDSCQTLDWTLEFFFSPFPFLIRHIKTPVYRLPRELIINFSHSLLLPTPHSLSLSTVDSLMMSMENKRLPASPLSHFLFLLRSTRCVYRNSPGPHFWRAFF